jgi:hypothetical protein
MEIEVVLNAAVILWPPASEEESRARVWCTEGWGKRKRSRHQ